MGFSDRSLSDDSMLSIFSRQSDCQYFLERVKNFIFFDWYRRKEFFYALSIYRMLQDDVQEEKDEKVRKVVDQPEQITESASETEKKLSQNSRKSSFKKKLARKRLVFKGQAHIQCTYNNTMISVTDLNGGTLGWSSSGLLGFKGAKKSTPYAATQVVADVVEKVRKHQMKELDVFVKGVGSGREAAIRAFSNSGFTLLTIKDITPIPHNGCRPKRPRRV